MTDRLPPKIHISLDAEALAAEAARRVVEMAGACVAESGSFTFALAGGKTPEALYRLLAAEPYRSAVDWPRVEIYFGDERCVPPYHPDSNYRMAKEILLDRVPITPENVHRMRGEIEPQAAAIEYGQMLKDRFGDGGLDLALLGMGDDGHTASLFPGTAALTETHHRCVANRVEKLNTWRITLSAPFINRSREVLILVSGAGKAARVKEVIEEAYEPQRLPIQLIQAASGGLTWLLDTAAASM